jgi:hypothetical protein
MGMDVYGRRPDSMAGKYFQANVWSWRPIHDLIIDLCSDILPPEMLKSLAYCDGVGPTSQKVCSQMAERFERWMEHNVSGHEVDLGMRVEIGTGLRVSLAEAEDRGIETETAHQTSDEHLKKWINFLCHCGGFRVC